VSKKILFVHLPKTGGVYVQRVLEPNSRGASIGHFRLHDICDPNRRALLSGFMDKAAASLGQENCDELTHRIATGQKLNRPEADYIVCSAIRRPSALYKSLYQYLIRRNFGDCVCGILSRMDWEDFVDLLLDRERVAEFSERNRENFRPKDLFENMVLDYGKCPADIGFFSFVLLSRIFVRDIFSYSIDEIIDKADDLALIQKEFVLKTERLKADFLEMVGDSENRSRLKNLDAFPNSSPNVVTVSPEREASIYRQEYLIYGIYGYDENQQQALKSRLQLE
jgi:hypothetical protein